MNYHEHTYIIKQGLSKWISFIYNLDSSSSCTDDMDLNGGWATKQI